MQTIRLRRCGVALVLSALAAALPFGIAACGGSSSDSSSSAATSEAPTSGENAKPAEAAVVDVGLGKGIPLRLDELRIAYVAGGLQTSTAVQEKKGIEEVASRYGIPVDTFDGELDINRQYSLYQTVIDSGKYNVLLTLPISGDQDCQILSKTAPEKGIVVSLITVPICGHESEPATGDGMWTPGTLNIAGANVTAQALGALADACAKETGGGETMLLNNTAGAPSYTAFTKAFEDSGLDIVANYATNYAAAEAVEKTSAALLARPNLKVIATTFPPLTEGALQALKAAGKRPGTDVKLCSNSGGTERMLAAVKAGELTVDNYANNRWVAIAATQSIVDAVEGKSVPRVMVPGENGEIVKSGTEVWPPVYTKATADQYEPTGE